MSKYEKLIDELKNATTEEEKRKIEAKILAIKAYNDAYKYNSKEMDLLS